MKLYLDKIREQIYWLKDQITCLFKRMDEIELSVPVQSDWSETDNTSLAYIRNKPMLGVGEGDKYLQYVQNVPSSVWLCSGHGLDKHPSVTITDLYGNRFFSRVEYIDNDNLKIIHRVPCTGKIHLN